MLCEQRNAAQETDAIRAEQPIETKVNHFDTTTKKPTWKEANKLAKYKLACVASVSNQVIAWKLEHPNFLDELASKCLLRRLSTSMTKTLNLTQGIQRKGNLFWKEGASYSVLPKQEN